MKLRGGAWVSDNSDAEALAAALIASASATVNAVAAPTRLLRCARNDEPLSIRAEFETPALALAAHFLKEVMR